MSFHNRSRVLAEVRPGIRYVRLICGEPPQDCELGVMWHEHDPASHPTVGLGWEYERGDAPWEYITRATTALNRFDSAVNCEPLSEEEEEEEPDEDDEGR